MFFSEYSLWLNTFLSSFKHVFFIMRHLYFCKSFIRLSYKNTITFYVTAFFNIFQEKSINRWFWGVAQKHELCVSFNKKECAGKNNEDPRHFRVVLTKCLRNPRKRQFPTRFQFFLCFFRHFFLCVSLGVSPSFLF